jgi:hypothetical protein
MREPLVARLVVWASPLPLVPDDLPTRVRGKRRYSLADVTRSPEFAAPTTGRRSASLGVGGPGAAQSERI